MGINPPNPQDPQQLFYLGLLDKLDNMRGPAAPPPDPLGISRENENRYRIALTSLTFFTGDPKGEPRSAPKDALVLEDVDRWVGFFESFINNTHLPAIYHRRALYERTAGRAKAYLLPHEKDPHLSLTRLLYGLRLRFV